MARQKIKLNESNYVNGSPFSIDIKRMALKTIKSRYSDGDQDITELVKLGLKNGDTYLKIKDNSKILSVEFDGKGVSSQEELTQLIWGIYGANEDDETNLNHLGTAIAAALSKSPLEVIIETHDNGEQICMGLDKSFKPTMYEPNSRLKGNRVTIVKSKDSSGDMSDTSSLGFLDTIIQSSKLYKHNQRIKKIKGITQFSDKDVTINGRRNKKGFKFKNSLFQKEYQIGGSKIVLSIPNNFAKNHKTIKYFSNNVPLESEITQPWKEEYSNLGVNRGPFLIKPDILVENPSILLNTKGNQLLRDDNFTIVEGEVEQAISQFYSDFIKGEFEDQVDANHVEEKRVFSRALFSSYFNGNFDQSKLEKYMKDPEDYLSKLSKSDAIKIERLFSMSFFEDLDGNQYTMPGIYQKMGSIDYMYLFTGKKMNRNDPAIKGTIKKDELVLFFEDYHLRNLFFENFVHSRNPTILARYNFHERDEKLFSHCHNVHLLKLEDILSDHKYKMDGLKRKRKKQLLKTTKGAGGTAIGGGVCYGLTQFAPAIASVATEASKFLFVTCPGPTAIAFGGILAGCGLYKSRPYIAKGARYAGWKTAQGAVKSAKGIGKLAIYAIEKTQDSFERIKDRKIAKPLIASLGYLDSSGNLIKGKLTDYLADRKNKKEAKRISQLKNYCSKYHSVRVEIQAEQYLDLLISQISSWSSYDEVGSFDDIGEIVMKPEQRSDFKLKKLHNNDLRLVINPYSNSFKKRVEKFYETQGRSLFSDLEELNLRITNRKYGFNGGLNYSLNQFNDRMLSELYNLEVNQILNLYSNQSQDFFKFNAIEEKEQRYILRRIISETKEGIENKLDERLVSEYGHLIEEVSEDIAIGRGVAYLKNMKFDDKKNQSSIELFESLLYSEKMDILANIDDVGGATLIDNGMGVIKLSKFDEHISERYSLSQHIAKLKEKNLDNEYNEQMIESYHNEKYGLFMNMFKDMDKSNKDAVVYVLGHIGFDTTKKNKVIPKKIRGVHRKIIGMLDDGTYSMLSNIQGIGSNISPTNMVFEKICLHHDPGQEGSFDKNLRDQMKGILNAFYMGTNGGKETIIHKMRQKQFANPLYNEFKTVIQKNFPEYSDHFQRGEAVIK